MPYQIVHATYQIHHGGGRVTEPIVYFDERLEGGAAAQRRFDAYLAAWQAVDTENRRVRKRGNIKADLVERPVGCECRICHPVTGYVVTAPGPDGQLRDWGYWGYSTTEHTTSYARINRLDQPTARAKAATWRVIRRSVNASTQPSWEVVSEHFTKSAARSGMHQAVRDWRDYSTRTATQRGTDGYTLKVRSVGQYTLAVEPVPPMATVAQRDALTRKLTGATSFEALLAAGGSYRPTISVTRDAEYLALADAYDRVQEERGDVRRAHRI